MGGERLRPFWWLECVLCRVVGVAGKLELEIGLGGEMWCDGEMGLDLSLAAGLSGEVG